MGANITAQGKSAVFEGVDFLSGAPVYASDLRAGAALIIAGIIANGETDLYNLDHIDRGYECIEEKFRNLIYCYVYKYKYNLFDTYYEELPRNLLNKKEGVDFFRFYIVYNG
jgi:hypothetical protein